MTLFTLAVKMLELPLTAVFWSIGFLALPALSSLYQTDLVAAHARLSRDLRLSVFLGLIASIVIGSVPEFWVSLFFSTGHFSSEQLALLAQDLAIGASAFPAMAATTILLNDAFARRQLWPVLTLILCTLMGVGSLAYLGATVFVWQKILMSAWVILYCLLAVALYVRRQRRFQSPMRLGRFEILCLCGVQGLWLGAGMFGGEEAPLLGVIVSLCLCAALALTTPYRECMRGLLQTLRRKVGAR